MNDDLVSIITPMYNSEKYIAETIESVLKQTYELWELIIVDDCSSDLSCEIVDKYANIDRRIKLIKKSTNEGPAKARNKGINLSVGRYIAYLDSDDIWNERKLEVQISYMKKNNVAISCSSYYIFNNNVNSIKAEFKVPRIINYRTLLKRNYFSCDTVVIDRRYVEDIEMESFYKHEDYVTWLKIIKQVENAHGINEPLAYYRLSENSRSSSKIKNIWPQFEIYYKIEKIGLLKSIYYVANVCIKSLIKYSFKYI